MSWIRNWQTWAVLCVLVAILAAVGCSKSSSTSPDPSPTPPGTPEYIQATSGDATIAVIWTPSADASSYKIYWSTNPGVTADDSVVVDIDSPFIHTDLENDTTYHYVVVAVNDIGESEPTSEVSATPVMSAVYVSPVEGDDANSGDRAAPVATLARAYEVAADRSLTTVHMEAGVYEEVPAFREGIWVLGGHDLPDWTIGTNLSLFSVGEASATADDITALTIISRLEILTNPSSVGNSVALRSTGSGNGLVFEACRFTSGSAGSGTAGQAGDVGAPGGDGGQGEVGSCDGPRGLGGPGGTAPTLACSGGGGGHGGLQGPNAGTSGANGGCNGGTGGVGGIAGSVGINGGNGRPGVGGSPGSHGVSASADGNVVAGEWVPNISQNGVTGGHGAGGGGGGGGAGQGGPTIDDGGGNGGGGGGGGGAGGTGGSGASGGFGSFAVFLVESSPTFDNCTFVTGQGGRGGIGGSGGRGGLGGIGGFGAVACSEESIGRGGDGGRGGLGGGGGGGAGGPGGPSIGVYCRMSDPILTDSSFVIGTAGTGGRGGLRGGTTNRAPDGNHGREAAVWP